MNRGTLNGEIFLPENISPMPKQIELFDEELNVHSSQWETGNEFSIKNLQPGLYIVRLSLPSGILKEQVIQVHTGVNTIILDTKEKDLTSVYDDFRKKELEDNPDNPPFFKEMIRILSESANDTRIYKESMEPLRMYSAHVVLWVSNDEQGYQSNKSFELSLDNDQFVAMIETESCSNILEINFFSGAKKLLSVPPESTVKINVSDGLTPQSLYVSITTDNWKSEALLTLLTRGGIDKAKTLTNAIEAEQLLYDKQRDATAAAIGGYFLLKIGALDRLHDWAKNLANWFPWLPDGAIIYAWQMIRQNEQDRYMDDIRNYLIQASKKIPVYTEGLRLLIEAFRQLSYITERKDQEVEAAYTRVKKYVSLVDWNQQTTTLNLDFSEIKQGQEWQDIFSPFSVFA